MGKESFCQFRYPQSEFSRNVRPLKNCRLGLTDAECTPTQQEACGRQSVNRNVVVGSPKIVRRQGANPLGQTKETFKLPFDPNENK